MDREQCFEKNSTKYDEKNLFYDGGDRIREQPKVQNVQWSVTNERLRVSQNTEHYSTINDTLTDDNRPKFSTGGDERTLNSGQTTGHQYLTFNGGDWFPTHVNNDITELYSYAITDTRRALNFQERQDGNESGHCEQISLDVYAQENSKEHPVDGNHSDYKDVHYDNSKSHCKVSHRSPSHLSERSQILSDIQYGKSHINRTDTYLVPSKEIAKQKRKPADLRDIDWLRRQNATDGQNEYDCPDYSQLEGRTSTYVDKYIRRSPDVPNIKRSNKRKIAVLAIVLLMSLLIAVAVVVAVLMLTKSSENSIDCDDKDGCQSKCKKYTNVSNGQVNSTGSEEEIVSTAVLITCNEGFKVEGKDTAICLESGMWSHVNKCVPVDCGEYHTAEHMQISESENKTEFNTSVRLICENGFQFANQSDRFVWCNGSGHWIGNPKCDSLVDLSTNSSYFLVGGVGELTCEFRETPDWKKTELRRVTSENVYVTIVTIENSIDSYPMKTSSDNIKIVESTFTDDWGKIIVKFEKIQCSEAFEVPGFTKFTCDVHSSDSHIFSDKTLIKIQAQPKAPILTITPHVVEGKDTKHSLFVCDMLFPEPDGHLLIESDYNGTYNILLSSVNGEYKTEDAWIEDIKINIENCWYRTVVWFGLKKVSMKWHRKHLRCTAKRSDGTVNQTTLTSDNGVKKVIPGGFCHGQAILSYPYNCSMFVLCDKENSFTSVKEVRACEENNFCYDVNTYVCNQCSFGGCPVTDIYFKDGGSSTTKTALTIVCVVEDFKDLEDIMIMRGNGEIVSSIKTGDKINGFVTLLEMTHINRSSGMLALYVQHLLCIDEATYRCCPEGGGKYTDDVIDLDLNDCV